MLKRVVACWRSAASVQRREPHATSERVRTDDTFIHTSSLDRAVLVIFMKSWREHALGVAVGKSTS